MSSPAILSSEDSQESISYSPKHTSMNPASTKSTTPQPHVDMNFESRPRSITPDAPPYSPLTPTLSSATLPDVPNLSQLSPSSPSSKRSPRNSRPQHRVQIQSRIRPAPETISAPPPAVPISENSNPDAIAVRAALDVLQIQRKRALQDIYTLRGQKDAALLDPQRFAERLLGGDVKEAGADRDVAALRVPSLDGAEDDGDGGDDDDLDGKSNGDEAEVMPGAQEVVRCPPVNWTKYHIADGVLDRLHEEQRRRPGKGGTEGPEHAVMAPYRPFVDIAKEQTSATAKANNQKKRSV